MSSKTTENEMITDKQASANGFNNLFINVGAEFGW